MKFGWYIGSAWTINPMNFPVRTSNETKQKMRSVIQSANRMMAQYTLHTSFSFQSINKPSHVQSTSLDVSTKNSVDAPSKITIQGGGISPCRVWLHVQFWFNILQHLHVGIHSQTSLHTSFSTVCLLLTGNLLPLSRSLDGSSSSTVGKTRIFRINRFYHHIKGETREVCKD